MLKTSHFFSVVPRGGSRALDPPLVPQKVLWRPACLLKFRDEEIWIPGDTHLLLGKHSVQNYRSPKLKAVKGVILKKSLSVAAVTLLFLHCFFYFTFLSFLLRKITCKWANGILANSYFISLRWSNTMEYQVWTKPVRTSSSYGWRIGTYRKRLSLTVLKYGWLLKFI